MFDLVGREIDPGRVIDEADNDHRKNTRVDILPSSTSEFQRSSSIERISVGQNGRGGPLPTK